MKNQRLIYPSRHARSCPYITGLPLGSNARSTALNGVPATGPREGQGVAPRRPTPDTAPITPRVQLRAGPPATPLRAATVAVASLRRARTRARTTRVTVKGSCRGEKGGGGGTTSARSTRTTARSSTSTTSTTSSSSSSATAAWVGACPWPTTLACSRCPRRRGLLRTWRPPPPRGGRRRPTPG